MIEFFSDTEFVFPESEMQSIQPVIEKIFNDYDRKLNYLHVIFMDDDQLLEINKEFLKHDYYTDIITFNYSEDQTIIEAELYISIDRVKENAEAIGAAFFQELNRIVIHGILHLCGYEDNTGLLKNKMQETENKYINMIVSRETI